MLSTCGVALMWEYMEDYAGGIENAFDDPKSSEYGNLHVLFMLFVFFLPFAIGAASFRYVLLPFKQMHSRVSSSFRVDSSDEVCLNAPI